MPKANPRRKYAYLRSLCVTQGPGSVDRLSSCPFQRFTRIVANVADAGDALTIQYPAVKHNTYSRPNGTLDTVLIHKNREISETTRH